MASGSNKIFVSSDHNGNAARAYVIKLVRDLGLEPIDLGPTESDGKVDYVDEAEDLCWALREHPGSRGILICGTGTGMCITANRFRWIRAALVTDRATAVLSREHNDANVLVLGQWRTPLGAMDEIVKAWTETPWGAGRHVQRLLKLENLETDG